jgi:hypothetical protein
MNSPYLEFLFTIYSKRKRYAANVIRDNDNRINGKPSIFFFGNMTLDFDGSKRWKDDPTGQADTSLHYNGKPIDTELFQASLCLLRLSNPLPS